MSDQMRDVLDWQARTGQQRDEAVAQLARRPRPRVQAGSRHDATKRASDVGSVESSSVQGAKDEAELDPLAASLQLSLCLLASVCP